MKLRFGDLVRHSGRPDVLTLWTSAKRNRQLQKAIEEHRVLTVRHRNVGSRRDSGEIGFHQKKDGLYLIFPRPLKPRDGQEVIGINYELLEQPPPPDPARLAAARPALVPLGPRENHASPASRQRFRVAVRIQATEEIEVRAGSSKEAAARALEEAARMVVPENDWQRTVVRIRRK